MWIPLVPESMKPSQSKDNCGGKGGGGGESFRRWDGTALPLSFDSWLGGLIGERFRPGRERWSRNASACLSCGFIISRSFLMLFWARPSCKKSDWEEKTLFRFATFWRAPFWRSKWELFSFGLPKKSGSDEFRATFFCFLDRRGCCSSLAGPNVGWDDIDEEEGCLLCFGSDDVSIESPPPTLRRVRWLLDDDARSAWVCRLNWHGPTCRCCGCCCCWVWNGE